MAYFMDISRDDEGEINSVVTGCKDCGIRTLNMDVQEGRYWVTQHAINFHKNTESRAVEQIGCKERLSKRDFIKVDPLVKPIQLTKAQIDTLTLVIDNPTITIRELADVTGRQYTNTRKSTERMISRGHLIAHRTGQKVRWEVPEGTIEALKQKVPTMTPQEDPKAVQSLTAPFYGAPPLLQKFGAHAEVYGRFGFKGHMGNDYGMVMQPVLAAHDGIVEFAGDGGEWPIMGAAAGTCILLDGDDLRTGYAHLHHSYVGFGDKVKAGDVIAISGDTGATTGFHLHFEVLPKPTDHKNGYAGRVDPTPYLPEAPSQEAPHE